MNRVELYSLITISVTICMGGYSNVDAGAGAGGSLWGCGGDVSWVDMVVIISNGLSILWMLVLLIFGGRTELVNQGRRLGSMIMQKRRSQSTAALHSLDNPLSRPGSMGDIELSEVLPSLAIGMGSPSRTENELLDTDNSETVIVTASTMPLNRAASVQAMKAFAARANLDPALMDELDPFLVEGTESISQGKDAGQEEEILNEKDRQQPRRQQQNEDDNQRSQGKRPQGAAGPQVAIGVGSLPMRMANEDDSDGNSCSSADLQSPPPNMGTVTTAHSEDGGILEVDL